MGVNMLKVVVSPRYRFFHFQFELLFSRGISVLQSLIKYRGFKDYSHIWGMLVCFLWYNWYKTYLLLATLISVIWLSPTVSGKCFLPSLPRRSWCITQMCHRFLSLRSAHEWPVNSINKGHKLALLSGSLLFPAPVVVDSGRARGFLGSAQCQNTSGHMTRLKPFRQ